MSRGRGKRDLPVADDAGRRARRHDHHPVGKRDRLFEVVGDEQHRLAVRAPEIEQQVAHDLPGLRIKRPERLVHQQDLRIADKHLHETDALSLPAREHVRVALAECTKVPRESSQVCARARACLRSACPRSQGPTATFSSAVFQGNSASA